MTRREAEGNGPVSDALSDLDTAPLSQQAAAIVRKLLEEPPRPVTKLQEEISSYLEDLQALKIENEFLDLENARNVAARLRALLDGMKPDDPPRTRMLIQAAARYFVNNDGEEEDDVASPIGFDDDAAVLAWVARVLGREDVLSIQAGEDR